MKISSTRMYYFRLAGFCLLVAVLTVGCGSASRDAPVLFRIRGHVTLDTKPLPDARVIFTPKGGGRPAIGATDGDGNYDIAYNVNGMGVPAGEYVVSINSGRDAEEDPQTGQAIPAARETIPVVYNTKSSLSATVPGEGGPYNFDLKSDAGQIVQPRAAISTR